jgi:predicted RNA-binding protein with PUA-like domain
MRPGDRVFIYHSGGVSAIVGLAEVASEPADDPANPKSAVVELRYVCHLDPPTTLAEVKSSGKFNDWALVRQGRLSTMAAPDSFAKWMRARYPDAGI